MPALRRVVICGRLLQPVLYLPKLAVMSPITADLFPQQTWSIAAGVYVHNN